MKAIYPFVGGTNAKHSWNLKNTAQFQITWSGGVTSSANGVQFNGINSYGNTNFNCDTNTTILNNCVGAYSRTNVLGGSSWGAMSSGFFRGLFLSIKGTDNNSYYSANDYIVTGSGNFVSDTRGFYIVNRESLSSKRLYKNGTSLTSSNPNTADGTFNGNLFLGARNINNATVDAYDNKQYVFQFMADTLTATEIGTLHTAVQAFQTTLGRSIGTQTVSDADAQAFVTNAGIVDQVEANAINNLVIGMKADGLWTKMKAIYPMVGGTNSQHTWNLKNTAQYQISWQGGVTSSSNGVQFNNFNSYGVTGLIPSSALTLNSTHMSFYSRLNLGGIDDFGAYNGVNQAMRVIIKDSATTNHILDMNSTTQRVTGTVANSSGFFLCNRETSTALRSLRSNVSLGSNTNTNTGTLPSVGMYLGGLNNAGTFANPSARQCAFASVGDGLTATDETNLNSRVTTFQTTLNRNV
jgi:hypothetical protein